MQSRGPAGESPITALTQQSPEYAATIDVRFGLGSPGNRQFRDHSYIT